MERQPNTEYVLSLSYGKDSLACLFAIEQLGWPLDRIVHAEVWATDDIPADLPPMVEFKSKADAIIKQHWGIEVEHRYAVRLGEKLTYEKLFYHVPKRKSTSNVTGDSLAGFPYQTGAWCKKLKDGSYKMSQMSQEERIYGFPMRKGNWCTSDLKRGVINSSAKPVEQKKSIQYLGIAADEPERIARHTKPGFLLPLVEIGWDEAYCRKLCEDNDLLSPIYTSATRGGCWFCHNQGVDQLRLLRKNHPELWRLLLKWDDDSPVSFRPDGHTVHDFERRFKMEDNGFIYPGDNKFRWSMLDGLMQYTFDSLS